MTVAKKPQSAKNRGKGKKGKEEPRPEGRPTLYKPEMIGQAKAYIKNCPDFVPSLVGLAMELEVCESTLDKWKALNLNDLDPDKYPYFEEFLQILGRLHDFQKRTALNGGADGNWNSTIAKLVLGKHGYHDKQETELTGKDGGPLQIVSFAGATK